MSISLNIKRKKYIRARILEGGIPPRNDLQPGKDLILIPLNENNTIIYNIYFI
jgi:hypothetical protein